MQFQKFDIKQVGEDAEIPKDPGAALTHQHQKLELEVEVEKEGYMYVYFSNEDM